MAFLFRNQTDTYQGKHEKAIDLQAKCIKLKNNSIIPNEYRNNTKSGLRALSE